MNVVDWLVLLGGIAAIAWVNWYFFFAEATPTAAVAQEGGAQEVTITIRGAYSPATVRVHQGAPVRLVFDRQETAGCSEEVVFPDFGIRKFLPAFQKTTVQLTPEKPGTYEFTCGMSMLRGKLIVE